MNHLQITFNETPCDHRYNESDILNIPVANLDYDGVVDQIISWTKSPKGRYIGVCNVHSITSSTWDPKLREALLNSDLNTADGMPLVWMQKLLGFKKASRVYGPTLVLKTLEKAVPKKLRMAFYGGHPERLPVFLENLNKMFPGLEVVETICPPFRSLTEEEDEQFTQTLNKARPDIIWVGIGCPKQELWMMEHKSKLNAVMIGVGAAFDFHAGAVKQAPPYLQKIGLEWLYRLYCEPRRLFKRYLTTNPVFMIRAIEQLLEKLIIGTTYIHPRTGSEQNNWY
jgi:N-acetylglucosaminyldiphosphoundecaprenol N-acetyl-beta-D-mannosaminyltransferase